MITGAIVLGTGLVVAAFGVAIRRGHTELIAGYDAERVTDEAGLAAFVGRYVLAIGAFVVAVGALELSNRLPDEEWVWLGFTAVIVVLTLGIAVGAQRFQK